VAQEVEGLPSKHPGPKFKRWYHQKKKTEFFFGELAFLANLKTDLLSTRISSSYWGVSVLEEVV
jgi:hypothetical protein